MAESINENFWSTPIDNLMQWKKGVWVKYNCQTCVVLVIHYDQLLIKSKQNLLETLSLNGKIKGIFKDDIIIMFIRDSNQGIRKIKFQLKMEASRCIQKLNLYFPVLNHNWLQSKCPASRSQFVHVEDFLKRAIEENDVSTIIMPQNYSAFIKLCLLDPNFPQIVNETQNILDKIIK